MKFGNAWGLLNCYIALSPKTLPSDSLGVQVVELVDTAGTYYCLILKCMKMKTLPLLLSLSISLKVLLELL